MASFHLLHSERKFSGSSLFSAATKATASKNSASSAIFVVSYTYEPSTGRLSSVSDGAETFTCGYEPSSNLLASLTAPQHIEAYSCEANRNVMTTADNQVSSRSPSKDVYAYDALGRGADREQSDSAFVQTNKDTFAYNRRSEVEGSTNDVLTGVAYNPSYNYDQIGNRPGNVVDTNGTTSYTANALNQYTAVGVNSPVHDLDGNLTSDGSWTYTWNGENRLINAADGTNSIDFTYDYQGRLVKKDDGADTEFYVYDGWNRIATFAVQTSNFTLQTSYLWGLDLSGSMQDAGGVGRLLKEGSLYRTYYGNGNVMGYCAADTGENVAEFEYGPFGELIRATGSKVDQFNFRFSTKYEDAETGLLYYGYRYYDAETGRWLSRDPIAENGGINLYAYVGNNPIMRIDPLGLKWYHDAAIGGLNALESGLSFAAGVGDAATFELTSKISNGLNDAIYGDGTGDAVDKKLKWSKSHTAGQWASLGLGGGRLAYAGAAKASSLIQTARGATMANARAASSFRNGLKKAFRLNPFSKFRVYPFEKIAAKYGDPKSIIDAAGRTDGTFNALGADLAAGGAYSLSKDDSGDCD